MIKNLLLLLVLACLGCDSLTGKYTGADKLNSNQPEKIIDPPNENSEAEVEVSQEPKDPNGKDEIKVVVPAKDTEGPKVFKLGGLAAKPLSGIDTYILDGVAGNSGDAGHAFELKLKLKLGQASTFTFFGSKKLKGGIDITFQNVNGTTEMTILHNEISHTHVLEGVDPKSVNIVLDIHNDHADTHILAWKKNSAYFDNEGCTFEGKCLYNSEDFAFDIWVGVGKASGVYWGVKNTDADTIIQLKGPLNANSKA